MFKNSTEEAGRSGGDAAQALKQTFDSAESELVNNSLP